MKHEEKSELWKIRHTCEHIFNQAVEELFPGNILRAMGPPIDEGWYNDSRWSDVKISEEDFPKIEARMQEIIDADLPMIYKEISVEEAQEIFAENPFKLEFIDEFSANGEDISLFYTGDPEKGEDQFVDLCRGPHTTSTGNVKAFKLLSIAGAYWRGDEKNEMLTRVYGTVFSSEEELEKYLWQAEEAKKRDHKKLGKELDLLVFSELVGRGLPIFTFKGTALRNEVFKYSKELSKKIGYKEVSTPNVNRAELFKISGHYAKYKDDMVQAVSQYDKDEMFFKPMNCPQHTQIFASQMRSYRDLPFRIMDCANLMRDERPGEINGILRPRIFAQDDGHAFCTPEQAPEEVTRIIEVLLESLKTYGMEYKIRLSLHDPEQKEKYIGTREEWEDAENTLREILKENEYEYYEGVGEAAFYAPKLDFMAIDALGREWQICTVQIDPFMPKNFGLEYIDENGEKKTPVMIHRALIGSAERFLGIYIEHTAGQFPTWLSPVQIKVIPVSDKFAKYAAEVDQFLEESGEKFGVEVRNEIDIRSETLQYRIRDAEQEKVPYILVVGGKEESARTVSVRVRGMGDQGPMPIEQFAEKLTEEIKSRKLNVWE